MTAIGERGGDAPASSEAPAPRALRVVEGKTTPPARTTERPAHGPPLELTSFVGREREMAEVEGLLADDTRLLTLTGPGGCGKTRLATAVVDKMEPNFDDGLWWVGLASISDPTLLVQEATRVLGAREAPGRAPAEALIAHFGPKRSLLVLDNCEHLIEACAALADTLLRSCPNLKILATSREALGIAGERAWVVPSLSLPGPTRPPSLDYLAHHESIRLFVDRARSVVSGFELTERNAPAVARVCQKLDGIPLAIELAAVRVKVLSVEQISERLEEPMRLLTLGNRAAAARHQTLRATLEWSHELLNETEQALFRRLSLFAGGWTIEAAEAVGAAEPVEAERVLDLLSKLVDKSLVVAEAEAEGTPRYRMLEPVRQYALERLVEIGEAEETRRLHAAFFVAMAEEAEPKLTTAEQVTWLERLEADHNNLRAVLSWSLGVGEAETALRLGAALSRFWYVRGYLNEGRRWLEEALSLDGGEPSLRARVLSGGGDLAHSQGDLDHAEELREAALAVSRRLGDEVQVAAALNGLAFVIRRRSEYARARSMHQEALELYRKLGDRWGVARSMDLLGRAAAFQGDYAVALPRLEEGLRMWREVGDRQGIAESTAVIGMVALGKRHFGMARSLLKEARSTMEELGDPRGIAKMTVALADVDLNDGDYGAAQTLYEEALALLEDVDDRWWMAWCLEGMAGVSVAQRRPDRAVRLFGVAEALRRAIGAPRPPGFRDYCERNLAAARDSLDKAAFENAREEGRSMAPEQAIKYALDRACLPAPGDTTVAMRTPPDASGKNSEEGSPPAFSGGRGGDLRLGEEALSRGAWEEARRYFQASLSREETPEALEGLGMAAWWLDDGVTAFEARERAYGLYRRRGDDRGAARVATWLAWDYNAFRGEPAIANGWLRRAASLLERHDTVPEHGWLALREGEIALLLRNDTPAARRLGARAATVGRSLGLIDLEMVGQALEGLARVSEGEIAEGMRRLDEATAATVAGELTDLCAMGLSSCYLLFACERVHDHDRAAQWCGAVKEFCKRWRIRLLFAICRAHYATSLTYRGNWEEAEAELIAADRELAEVRPGMMVESGVRLGELRRRQGREEEAIRLFERFAIHPLAQLGLAAVAFDLGDAAAAADLVERHLRALPAEDRLERVSGLELAIRSRLALGDYTGAGLALAELEEIAATVDTDPLRASLYFSEGLIAAFENDQDRARRRFEDALDLWTRSGMPFEAARARLELARTLLTLTRRDAALREARLASEGFRSLGAASEQGRAATLVRILESTPEDSADGATGTTILTEREREILGLIARGLSNPQIAAKLVLSEHTIHRHVANILGKLEVSSRAAAVASAARQGLL